MARTTTARDSRPVDRMWAALESWDCSACGQPMPFEKVPCVDGHDDDCPDRICTGCGAVLVVFVSPTSTSTARRSA